jgi:uncharacterized protein with von Willebrand factor type A (vWA) domain
VRVRFGRWTGSQDPFPADVTADDVLNEIGDDLLGGRPAEEALERLLRRGLQGRVRGLDDLRRRVEEAHRRELGRMGLEGPLREVEERLGEILERERTALHFSPDPLAADLRRQQLEGLPDDIAGKLGALEHYEWADRQAGQDFRDLLEQLRRDVAEATFGRLAGALGSMSPQDLERMRDMLADLNAMVAKSERGEDTAQDFADFKERYGDMIPGDPQSLEEFLEELARRMAAMSRLMASLDPDQRAQLAQMAEQLLGDMDLGFQADQLSRSLASRFPELGWGEGVGGALPSGRQSGSLSDTVDWVEHLQEYADLGEALGQDYPGARLEDVDPDALRRALGEDAVRDLRALQEIERALEEAGAAKRSGGRLELTPRGIRRLGERSLAKIYERAVTGQIGSHRANGAGGDGELTGATRPLRFGDPFRLDVARSLYNAITRTAGEPGEGGRVRLRADDFELAEAERRVRAATVLLLDMSFSMPLRGNWVPAKRVALALHSLISSKFPEDRFYVVGFSDYARRLQPRDLLQTGWERVYGTNMQHAFMLARRLLGAHPGAEQQVIMVTDGEPTAHLEGDQPWFAWPPDPKTLRLTLAEAARLARTGATLNVFLLDHDPGAARFVEQMVRSYGGRIFYPDLADLGSLVVRDFLVNRRAA